jgi:peptidoglycan/xylan/chitin deacetylase (PgdA/CDA1 family)
MTRIPILVYHNIIEDKTNRSPIEEEYYSVNLNEFKKQLEYLKSRGYNSISLDDIVNLRNKSLDLPARPIVLTFDDGNVSNYNLAYPLLCKYGFKAVFFVIAQLVGKQGVMSWAQLKEVSENTVVGSHGLTHRFLTKLTYPELKRELQDSKLIIEDNIKKPVKYLAIPGGFYNARVKFLAENIGYHAICTSSFGLNDGNTNLLALRRIGITYDTNLGQFGKLINPGPLLSFYKRAGQFGRNLIKNISGIERYTNIKKSILRRREWK